MVIKVDGLKKTGTISPEYQKLNAQLHLDKMPYGISGAHYVGEILKFSKSLKIKTILDYGCGKGLFKLAVDQQAPQYKVYEYDPAIPGKERCRERADLVVCNDVLEHIEPEYLDNVLKHIKSISEVASIFLIDHKPAVKNLADGRNAHLIQEPYNWWREKLEMHFYHPTVLVVERCEDGTDGRTLVAVSAKKLRV